MSQIHLLEACYFDLYSGIRSYSVRQRCDFLGRIFEWRRIEGNILKSRALHTTLNDVARAFFPQRRNPVLENFLCTDRERQIHFMGSGADFV